MNWQKIYEEEIHTLLAQAWDVMDVTTKALWESIKIIPEKWQLDDYTPDDDGYWVVAVKDNFVIWYNNNEAGFNVSAFKEQGQIQTYGWQQDELETAVNKLSGLL